MSLAEPSAARIEHAVPSAPDPTAAEPGAAREAQPSRAVEPPFDTDLDLHGVVVTTSGEPIADAVLTVLLILDRQAPDGSGDETVQPLDTARTSADGRFRFRLEPAETYDLDVHAPGRAHQRRPSLYAGEELRIVLPRAAAIVGRVVEAESGAPLAGVEVAASAGIVQVPGALRPRTRTAADGSYRLEALDADVFALDVTSAHHARAWLPALRVDEGADVRADFELERGLALRGRVTDGSTHAPIAAARVELHAEQKLALTGTDGRYKLLGLPGGNVALRVQAAGYGRFDYELSAAGSEDMEQDFFLLPGRSARGRIVDRTGAPIAHASVSAKARLRHDSLEQNDLVHDWSDADGRFELVDLRADLRHTLFVQAEGHASALLDFPAGEWDGSTLELGDLALGRPSTIAGRMLDVNDRPLAELSVLLTAAPAHRDALGPLDGGAGYAAGEGFGLGRILARTDARGRYAFTDLPAGRYGLSGGSKGFARRANLELELVEGEELHDVDLVLDLGLTLEGVVVDTDGRPLPGATVSVWSQEAGSFRSPLTYDLAREDGRFRIVGLEPGLYDLTADAGFSSRRDPPGFETRLAEVTAGTTDLRILLARPARIAGTVVDGQGRPVAGAQICLAGLGGAQLSKGETDESGRFQVWVADGTTPTLTVIRAEDWRAGEERCTRVENISAGEEDIVVTLMP